MFFHPDQIGGTEALGHGLVDPVEESGKPKSTPLLHQTKVHWSTIGRLDVVLLLRLQFLIDLGGDYRAHHGWVMEGALQLVLTQSDQQLVGPTASVSGRHPGERAYSYNAHRFERVT